jgi:acetolactate synthase regulatory subunit
MQQLISLLVENKPGALMRVAGVLTARGYNIESLTVAKTLDPAMSSMTIVADVDPVMSPRCRFDQFLEGWQEFWILLSQFLSPTTNLSAPMWF